MTETGNRGQSRLVSLVEAIANVLVGYGLAVLTQILVFPLFGLRTTLSDNLAMGRLHHRLARPILRPPSHLRGDPDRLAPVVIAGVLMSLRRRGRSPRPARSAGRCARHRRACWR